MGFSMKLRMIAAALLCFTAVASPNLKTFTATYGPFNSSYYEIFQLENSAAVANDTLQLTTDYMANYSTLMNQPLENQSGRVMLKQRFKLWEQGYNETLDRVASFNSSFLFNVYPLGRNTTPGEGLAFVIAPDTYIPANSFGQYMGLTNFSTDGSPESRLVAIEFDNIKQEFDPDANHVGLNINSIISTVNASLTPLGIEIAPQGEVKYYNVWVQYDGINKVIEVYIARQAELHGETPSRPDSPVLKSNLDLREVLDQYSYFGFSASTGFGVQINSIYRWNLTVDSYDLEDKHSLLKKTLFVVGVGVPLMMAVTGYYYLRKKRSFAQSRYTILLGELKRLPGTPREFQFKDLKKATNNLDEKNKLGQGGLGVVYRGHLQDENLEVAVKWFSRETIKAQDDFLAELTVINRLRHKHLVRLLGWCHKKRKLLLVYDYMPNGSLDAHLFTRASDNKPLSWDLRYKIISGVASALHYLHNEYDQRVVHRDLKASNIMLDSDFNARLGDFGLARALDKEKTSYTEAEGVVGTLGYIAPKCFLTGKATQLSDVYAFGAVLLEIVCGLQPGTRIGAFQFLVDWVWSLHREGRILDAVEERLRDEYVVDEAQKVLILALACSHPIANKRPRTHEIV
ncbi:hypothetical protein RHMOL_Rhmol07G0244400 [Rhododendron molle]|uniref:Uncharacterized protein n=2 Tax=Rhododendron molle TaxID=49168 RepID=A0ACC0N5C8_RHOML|nr:hypothetical protein RHMOL_Rhmol07G0244400 [Rhododendron molle]KAI8548076.1 hypothetical protein RHMOL_Rhmol07G0244400 [Rhododendron molle]